MKAFVTGASGFIGSHLVDELLKLGLEVICLIRKTSNLEFLRNKQVKLVTASLSDTYDYGIYLQDIDYIFHVAGVTSGKKKKDYYLGNFNDTKLLLETIKSNSKNLKKFIFISSQTVSGPANNINLPKTEESHTNPLTTYAISKKMAEDEVLKYKFDFPVTVLRVSAVFGPRDSAILAVFKSINLGIATIVGIKKKKFLNLIYIHDLIDGIVKASFCENTMGEIYFLASEEVYSWDELIPLIAKKIGKRYYLKIRLPNFLVLFVAGISQLINFFSKKPSVFNYEKGIDFVQDYWLCSVEKAKRDFYFKQNTKIDQSIEETINWYKEHNWL